MQRFLNLLEQTAASVDEAKPIDELLDAVRKEWKTLDPPSREATTPIAKALSGKDDLEWFSIVSFLSALSQADQRIGEHEAEGLLRTRQEAEEALTRLRRNWKLLPPREQAMLLPVSKLFSERLSTADARRRAKQAVEEQRIKAGTPDDDFMLDFGSSGFDGNQALAELGQYDRVPKRFYEGEQDSEKLLAWLGYPGFRPGQKQAVEAAFAGRDSLAIMPTGGGKSLCYQVPGIASHDLTIVVSPLIALIFDQHRRLAEAGHPSTMLASGLGDDWNRHAIEEIKDGTARVVFVAPERFAAKGFRDAIATRKIGLFVVDEAHCISSQGFDFRPDYLRLGPIIHKLGRPPIMALTATATPEVAEEIKQRLGLKDPVLVQASFDRPNISFDVVAMQGTGAVQRKFDLLSEGISKPENRPAVVYCGTRKDVETVNEKLNEMGISSTAYHAGFASDIRAKAQSDFMNNAVEVVVATNAFGMGVDKADVRSVWHWAIPTSIESYYQEAGRAGRDGKPSRAVLLSMRQDLGRLINFNKARQLEAQTVKTYVDKLQAKMKNGKVRIEIPEEDQENLCLAIAERAGAFKIEPAVGGKIEIQWLKGLNVALAATFCKQSKDRGWADYRIVEMFSSTDEYCRRRTILLHFGEEAEPNPTGRCCDVCDPIDWIDPTNPASSGVVFGKKKKPKEVVPTMVSSSTRASVIGASLSEEQLLRLEKLKLWRNAKAGGRPVYQIAHNEALEAIARENPQTSEEFLAIKGIGPTFVKRHLDDLLVHMGQKPPKTKTKAATKAATKSSKDSNKSGDDSVVSKLKEWRNQRASGKPAYTVLTNAALEELAAAKPKTAEEFLAIKGIGPSFVEKHMESVLEVL